MMNKSDIDQARCLGHGPGSDGGEYGEPLYEDLFDYYMHSGEMPYGTMKARDGDPDVWIADRLYELGLIKEEA